MIYSEVLRVYRGINNLSTAAEVDYCLQGMMYLGVHINDYPRILLRRYHANDGESFTMGP